LCNGLYILTPRKLLLSFQLIGAAFHSDCSKRDQDAPDDVVRQMRGKEGGSEKRANDQSGSLHRKDQVTSIPR
jgi:hypothetical protein